MSAENPFFLKKLPIKAFHFFNRALIHSSCFIFFLQHFPFSNIFFLLCIIIKFHFLTSEFQTVPTCLKSEITDISPCQAAISFSQSAPFRASQHKRSEKATKKPDKTYPEAGSLMFCQALNDSLSSTDHSQTLG